MNPLERSIYKSYYWIQLAFNLLFISFWFFANEGLAFWDDFTYLHFANQINYDLFEITRNHFTSRVGLIYPVAWIIRWTGINSYTITLFPLLSALLSLNLLMWYGRRVAVWVGVIGGLFLICDYHFLHFSTHLFPELPLAFCVLTALMSYDLMNRKEGDHRFLALLTATALFAAFLIKTTVFLVVPLFLYLFFNDSLRRRRNASYWIVTIACLLFFLILNLLSYYETKGDAFYRLNNISINHEPTVKTFFDKPWQDTLKRLTYLPFIGFLRGGFFISFLLALPALLSIRKKDWRLDDPSTLWSVSALLILISWWFMSTNWKYYSPMPVDTRHITFVIPLLLVAGIFWWQKTFIFKQSVDKKWPLTLLMGLFLIPLYKISIADQRNFDSLELMFERELLGKDQKKKATVFTDGLISYGNPYFYDFKKPNLTYVWWFETDLSRVELGDFILINPAFLNERYEDVKHIEKLKVLIDQKGWSLTCELEGQVQLCEITP